MAIIIKLSTGHNQSVRANRIGSTNRAPNPSRMLGVRHAAKDVENQHG